MAQPPNPWGLTTMQVYWLERLIEYGTLRLVAYAQSVSPFTLAEHMRNARKRMGKVEGRTLSTLQCAVLFDRWKRSAK